MMPFEFVTLPLFSDDRGSLVPVELKDFIDWTPKRTYFLFGNKDDRGGHCHRIEKELFICQQGELTVRLHDGKKWHEERIKSPTDAVRVDNMVWHEFTDFSENAILLAVSSTNYDKEDYIRDFDQFLNETKE